jgi:hypothetical protein
MELPRPTECPARWRCTARRNPSGARSSTARRCGAPLRRYLRHSRNPWRRLCSGARVLAAGAPGEVHVLELREEALVEAAQLLEHLRAEEHGAAGRAESTPVIGRIRRFLPD